MSQKLSSLLMELIVAEVQLLHLVIALQRDKYAETTRSSGQLQPAVLPRFPHKDETEGYQTQWNLQCLGDISTEIAALHVPKQSFVRPITSQWLSSKNSRSNGTWCCANFPCIAHVWPQHILQFCSCPCFTATIVPWPRALSDTRSRSCLRAASAGASDAFGTGTNQRSQTFSFYWKTAKLYEVGLLILLEIFLSPRCHSVVPLHGPEGLFLSQTHTSVLRKC